MTRLLAPSSGPYRISIRAALATATLALVALALLAPPAFAQETVASGIWTAGGYKIDGNWSIVREGGGYVLVLDDAFFTKSGPDLKLYLSPRAYAELDNRNAAEGAKVIAVLTANRGSQRFSLPGDPASYRSLVLHSEKYSKLWGGADLR